MRYALALAWLMTAGCFVSSGHHDYNDRCISSTNGVLSIRWTLDGQPANAETCAAAQISSLSLYTYDDFCGNLHAHISPIPCDAGKVRFDDQLLGMVRVELDALDSSDRLVYRGEATFETTESVPATPELVALTPPAP